MCTPATPALGYTVHAERCTAFSATVVLGMPLCLAALEQVDATESSSGGPGGEDDWQQRACSVGAAQARVQHQQVTKPGCEQADIQQLEAGVRQDACSSSLLQV